MRCGHVSRLLKKKRGVRRFLRIWKRVYINLAGRFYTKQVFNVDAVARTFKPLWRTVGELKIRDIGEHILLFEFKDALDLERVMEFEP